MAAKKEVKEEKKVAAKKTTKKKVEEAVKKAPKKAAAKTESELKEDFRAYLNKDSSVKKVIGVVSGKGGVGKSFVTSFMSVLMKRKGYNVGILDADITGPSIPAAFNVHEKAMGTELGIMPAVTKSGINVISVNMMLDSDETPVIWRGPVIAGVVKQFWTDVIFDSHIIYNRQNRINHMPSTTKYSKRASNNRG